MATNKVITVTTIPTLTGDTVASYNAYSNIDGLLGALTPAEAAAGKTFALSDGASHNVTVKTVWTTAGESTTNESNIVGIDLSSVVLFEDDFTGTTIDTAKWAITQVNTTIFEWDQNGSLRGFYKTSGAQNNWDNNLITQNAIPMASIVAITFDLTHENQNSNDWIIGLSTDANITTNSNRFGIQKTSTAGRLITILREAGVTEYTSEEVLDLSTLKTIKMTIISNTLSFYYWGGSSWTLLGSNAITLSGNALLFIHARQISGGAGSSEMFIDNLAVTDYDFATLRP